VGSLGWGLHRTDTGGIIISVYWHFGGYTPQQRIFLCVQGIWSRQPGLGGRASSPTARVHSCSAHGLVPWLRTGWRGTGLYFDANGGVGGVVLGGRSVAVMSRNSKYL